MLQKPMVNCRNYSDPQKPVGVTVSIPIQVWCLWVQVWVDKKNLRVTHVTP